MKIYLPFSHDKSARIRTPSTHLGEFPGTVILFTQLNKEKCDKSRSLASLIIKIVLNKKHSI